MVFSVAQSLNPKFPKKILNFQNYWAPKKLLEFFDFHVFFGSFSRNPKKTWRFLDFQQKSKKTHGKFWIFSRNQKNTWTFFGFFSGNPKNHMEIKNFQKFLGRPIFLEILDFLKILDFFKFMYVVTTESPLFNKLLIKSLY